MSRTGTLLLACLMAAAAHAQTPADTTRKPLDPGWWYFPGTDTRFTLNGYVKADLIHDLKPIGSPNFFDVTKIPTDGSTGTSTHLQAMETRLLLDVRRDSRFGELRGYVEGDFYGANNTFRIRHAMVEIGKRWLVGQYWSSFMDEKTIPPTLDFEKPGAYAFLRVAQVRYNQPITKAWTLSLALEDPSANIITPGPGKVSTPMPDFVLRNRIAGDGWHVILAGFLASPKFEPDSGKAQTVMATGVNLSAALKTNERDELTAQVLYGPGVSRYRGYHYAAPDENGDIVGITALGGTISYHHWWSKSFSSVGAFSYGTDKPEDGEPDTDADVVTYGAIDLLWHFAPKAMAGIEYLHGLREDLLGNDGTADRIMLSVKMNFH